MNNRFIIVLLMGGLFCLQVRAQISPGELSHVHEQLEGVGNCTKCHEQGEEITGRKCLDCHVEIREAVTNKHGYHFLNAAAACVSCHKEHLGREESITRFDKKNFDHRKTGYALIGKHSALSCESCHSASKIKDPAILKNQKQYPHLTYLGLRQQCVDCHTDRHAKSLGSACEKCHTSIEWKQAALFSHAKTNYPLMGKHESVVCTQCHESLKTRDASRPLLFSVKVYDDCGVCHKSPHGEKFLNQLCRECHTPVSWSVVTGFNHSNTAFPLVGKHKAVACEKCHTGLAVSQEKIKKDFTTKPFRDCTPCHKSPHAESFSKKVCSSCHSPQQWSSIPEKNFDHNMTSFALRGKHASLNCSTCHKTEGNQTFRNTFKLTKKGCADCHEDKHQGQFVRNYANDCSRCHTEDSYHPSTFTFEQHEKTKFVLTSSHLSVACKECHMKQRDWVFHFDKITCESCHKDRHDGKFAEFMQEKSCDVCHVSSSWTAVQFDHAKTSFPLIGQHLSVSCSQCHPKGYKGTGKECSQCHSDPHAGQFTDKGKIDCSRCHTPIGRRALIFRHDLQSSFALTGAHSKVECGACHKPEMLSGRFVVRYKPLSVQCESCHQGKI